MCRSSEGLEVFFSLSEWLSVPSSCSRFFNSNNLPTLISLDAPIIPNLMMAKGTFGQFEEIIHRWDADSREFVEILRMFCGEMEF